VFLIKTLSDKNPNTIELRLKSNSYSVRIETISVGGGEILLSSIDEFKISFHGNKDMLLVVIENDKPENLSKIKEILGKMLLKQKSFREMPDSLPVFMLISFRVRAF